MVSEALKVWFRRRPLIAVSLCYVAGTWAGLRWSVPATLLLGGAALTAGLGLAIAATTRRGKRMWSGVPGILAAACIHVAVVLIAVLPTLSANLGGVFERISTALAGGGA